MTAATQPRRQRRMPDPVPVRAIRAHRLPEVIGLSRASIAKLLSSGGLPSFRVGRARLVAVADLDAWIAAQRDAAER